MQQVFAQLKVSFLNGSEWWLTSEQEAELSVINARYEVVGAVGEKIAAQIDLDRRGEDKLPRMRAGEVLQGIGIERPTNMQSKEANSMLRSLLGRPKRIKGINYWDVPWIRPEDLSLTNEIY